MLPEACLQAQPSAHTAVVRRGNASRGLVGSPYILTSIRLVCATPVRQMLPDHVVALALSTTRRFPFGSLLGIVPLKFCPRGAC